MNMNPTKARRLVIGLSMLIASAGAAAQASAPASPYAGQHMRAIKSLSEQDVAALRAGQGMALAKAAELNGYPGPAHVLELRQQLQLTDEQATATTRLMAQHKARAIELGTAVIHAERQLDTLFREPTAQASTIDEATARVGAAQAQLRAEHLRTHLAQTALLNAQQVQRYNELRGYTAASGAEAPAHKQSHRH